MRVDIGPHASCWPDKYADLAVAVIIGATNEKNIIDPSSADSSRHGWIRVRTSGDYFLSGKI